MNRPARRRSSYKYIQEDQQQTNATPSSSAAPNSSSSNNNNGGVMDGAHRKIELQSPEDLTYLINNVRRAAEEHINAAFPPVDGQDDAAGEDELRVRIEKLVADYISQTFTLAAPNLSINGFELDAKTFPAVYLATPAASPPSGGRNLRRRQQQQQQEPVEEVQYEAFDGRKRARVEELAREEEDLMREIAALKRRVPAAAAAGFADGFWEGVRADEAALARAREEVVGALGDDAGQEEEVGEGEEGGVKKRDSKKTKPVLDDIGPLERQAGVEAGYEGIVGTLGRLKREMPATVAKMERARVAGEYVVTER
ncbi:hypothetical protein diail_276 [Diaporthe ilicicola]|nr:hypothetical protein diail_276 [Diaporthe ilicicola]